MKMRIVIDYEIPYDTKTFSTTMAKMIVEKALGEYLNRNEEIRRSSLTSMYKITSSISEYKAE